MRYTSISTSIEVSIVQSRIFVRLSQKRGLTAPGRGIYGTPTKVIRLPEDALIEVDALVDAYVARIQSNPASPRYDFLKKFIMELDRILPHAEQD